MSLFERLLNSSLCDQLPPEGVTLVAQPRQPKSQPPQ